MTAVAVVDCGMGNLHSVAAGCRRAQPQAHISVTCAAADIEAADKVILPGDGNFGACMREIDRRGLRDALRAAAREKPFLGICVGMQVLFDSSAEAAEPGLGIFNAAISRLPSRAGAKVPHMGWNTGRLRRRHAALEGIADGDYFYFVHSYCAPVGDWTLMTCDHGATFSAAVAAGRLVATQFHPEKSGRRGTALLENFLAS